MDNVTSKRVRQARFAYQVARQREAAVRLRQLADEIYGDEDNHRSLPLRRAADFLDGLHLVTTHSEHINIPDETQFMLNLIADTILNDAANARPNIPKPSILIEVSDDA